MDESKLKQLLGQFRQGKISADKLIGKLKFAPYQDLHFARLDYHRNLRIGIPEVIFCEAKSAQQVLAIVSRLVRDGQPVLATRLAQTIAAKLKKKFPRGKYNSQARTFVLKSSSALRKPDSLSVAIITAGTSDIPVAEEARETLEFLNITALPIYDVGVAGLHRFLGEEKKLAKARVLIVVAGMEGALASVVGGVVNQPVIAVPTSIGYGTSFAGLSPLLSMLNACSSGITVVNIDNGFGAACAAFRIIQSMRDSGEDSDL